MVRVVAFMVILGVAVVASGTFGPARAVQEAPAACADSWLIQMTREGRDAVEDALIAFEPDGALALHGPPVLPALPGAGEKPLLASAGLGTWQRAAGGECAFEAVRLLGSEDGMSVGTLNIRGMATVDAAGDGIDGSLTVIRSTGFGQTAAESAGALTGTSLDGPLLWLTPSEDAEP